MVAHHGLFWDFHPRSLSPTMKERLRVLFDNDIALAGYHLPLDAHPEVGNNALICAALGLERAEPFGAAPRAAASASLDARRRASPFDELRRRCAEVFGQEPFTWDSGPDVVRSVGIVSGAAASSFGEAIALGLDAFLTGEPAEHVMADARRERHALHRGGPLRHRDLRGAPARRARRGAIRRRAPLHRGAEPDLSRTLRIRLAPTDTTVTLKDTLCKATRRK